MSVQVRFPDENWLPTPENINALPEPVRSYIHDLETRADPAGDVRARIIAEDTIRALLAKLKRIGMKGHEHCGTCGGYGAVPMGGPPLDGQGPPERECPECTGRKVAHSNLGPCLVTEQCLELQRTNPDTTSMYVFHDGDIKEVSKALVTEENFQRASGDCVCDWCGKKYYDHPRYERERWRSQMEADSDHPSYPLRQLCDGSLVKL